MKYAPTLCIYHNSWNWDTLAGSLRSQSGVLGAPIQFRRSIGVPSEVGGRARLGAEGLRAADGRGKWHSSETAALEAPQQPRLCAPGGRVSGCLRQGRGAGGGTDRDTLRRRCITQVKGSRCPGLRRGETAPCH